MPSSVYLHDGEKQITVRFPTEEDRERFKAHYRALNALAMQFRTERDTLRATVAELREALIQMLGHVPAGQHYAGDGAWAYGDFPATLIDAVRAALTAATPAPDGRGDAVTEPCTWPECDCDRNLPATPCVRGWGDPFRGGTDGS